MHPFAIRLYYAGDFRGHEGVLVTKPMLFGHGVVDPVPATT
jgi:hypothetical protein